MKKILILLLVTLSLQAQHKSAKKSPATGKATNSSQPKLVIGIVVDQMSYDFLIRYNSKFSEGGFKRLVREGFSCKNAHYNYVPTYTAPGHTCVYTGSVPAIHGIAGNEWFDQRTGKVVYCTEDSTAHTVGSESQAGLMSPRNLLVTTITDQLRLSNNMQSKVVGIALKDRGAILPAGHLANAAYWFDSFSGNWITSDYYMKQLPEWVQQFNGQKLAAKYLSQVWTPLLNAAQYSESTPDDQAHEGRFRNETNSSFPHDLPKLRTADFELIRSTPSGNTITKDFALAAIKGENLGKGKVTDFLTVSFSSTDYVGHQYGPYAIETEDTYLRLDRDIAELLTYLDTYIGKNNVLVFLSADHAVAPAAEHMTKMNVPAGVFDGRTMISNLKKQLNTQFGEGEWIRSYENNQLYLNYTLLQQKGKTVEDIYESITPSLLQLNGVANVINLHEINESILPEHFIKMIKNGIHRKRSGDIYIALEPNWFEGRKQGTTHGSFYAYDTHVPVIFYGGPVKHGSSIDEVFVTDISATVAQLLNIMEPSGCIGKPIPVGK
ncbi:alkaline phosphatase family protein [Cytophagaceae bacterium YF14B1]|uniref:Alkaline phosphatase family protein n=1 Tax=Xanthocytophaga flava TaxID=3048013 RepID=A0AAE3U5P3_9BACT|nr:alkaline phosphatase PafA [Xanthocytophaga flavus]MDJ1481004.1 alkaline phosphatase family protein [Xanthocytophaga flavus]